MFPNQWKELCSTSKIDYLFNQIFQHFNFNTNTEGKLFLLDLQLPMQSVSITTKVVSLNPNHGKVYLIQFYVIKFVSDLRQVCGFLRVPWFPPPIKLTATI